MNKKFFQENFFYFIYDKNSYLGVETILINSCFLILFLTTLYYWINFVFIGSEKSDLSRKTKKQSLDFGFYGLTIANFLLLVQLSLRWFDSGHFPLSNLYDSLLFLSWGLSLIFLFLEKLTNLDVLGIIISPTILCIITFTDFSLPEDLEQIKPLVPALQSNWLFMHVTVIIFSYAALILGCLLSMSFILYYYLNNSVYFSVTNMDIDTKKSTYENRLNLLDNLSYRLIGIGFCFLTLGILSGAIWANETWGNYWSWDPKETWALITWLVFAIYLHSRLITGIQAVKSAWIAIFGFLILWVCYLGVNLLGQGLHSYGFLSN
uniref:Cytochrome c biogenesis protein CcsA n=1 Tax=Dicloster acuatus TaxID=91190 RepID=A0A097KQE8_9CHLO|nr:heme attachment to plastid cytochrome c [Dicloster acuatus]AIT95392.1 heme attachment to plastid cytochrome c [Dicloster acuatus]